MEVLIENVGKMSAITDVEKRRGGLLPPFCIQIGGEGGIRTRDTARVYRFSRAAP